MSNDIINYINYILESLYNDSQVGLLKFEDIYEYYDDIGSKIYEIVEVASKK